MSKCQWGDCPDNADKVVIHTTTEDERKQSLIMNERGVSWVQLVEKNVCKNHIEDALRLGWEMQTD